MRLWIEAALVAVGLVIAVTVLDISLVPAIVGAVFGTAYFFTRVSKRRDQD